MGRTVPVVRVTIAESTVRRTKRLLCTDYKTNEAHTNEEAYLHPLAVAPIRSIE